MKDHGGNCRITLQSMTQAIKAQKVLAGAAIPSEIVKTEPASHLRGCTYGIAFRCNQSNNVERMLSSAGISVKKWNMVD